MAFEALVGSGNALLSVAFLSIAIVATAFLYAFRRPSLPKNAPPLVTEAWPIIGSMQFFTQRSDFFQRQMAHSPTGNFTFYAGDKPVIGMSGDEPRRLFFDSKHLGFTEGYGALLGGSPTVNKKNNNPLAEPESQSDGFSNYFSKRLTAMLKGPILARGLPQLLEDVRTSVKDLAAKETKTIDPFDDIYRLVFQVTMRTVACIEIASDHEMLRKVLDLFETIESTAIPLSIMYSWIPWPSQWRRTYAGAKLYMIFKNIIDKRAQEGRREDDTLQYLIDQGDDVTKIITFVLGALFAGQLNSGINAAWILLYLAKDKKWHDRVLEEVETVANRYCSDSSIPLVDRLMQVPAEAWESEFPMTDLVLRESIRLQLPGTAFRKNISGRPIPLNKEGTEVIPTDAYAAFAVRDIHRNTSIYTDPETFDPERFFPERAEDKNKQFAYIGWGVGRHPCLGMRFAKLENNIIAAFWMAAFKDMELVDAKGRPSELPAVDRNFHAAAKPKQKVYINYKLREE